MASLHVDGRNAFPKEFCDLYKTGFLTSIGMLTFLFFMCNWNGIIIKW